MKNILKNIGKSLSIALMGITIITTSCNKGFEDVKGVTTNTGSNLTLAEIINTDPNYSLLRDQLARTGLMNVIGQKDGSYTLFAPDNASFAATNPALTSTAVINAVFRTGQMDTLLRYHLITNKIPAAGLPSVYPNKTFPSAFVLSVTPPNPYVRFPLFLNKNTNGAWANEVGITGPDAVMAQNGVIHKVAKVIIPPSASLLTIINASPNLTYLKAAIARADTNLVASPSSFTSLLGNGSSPFLNLTLAAPDDVAFKTLLFGLVYQGIAQTAYTTVYTSVYNAQITGGATPADAAIAATAAATAFINAPANVATFTAQATALTANPVTFFSNPAFYGALPASSVRGILAYHLLGLPPNPPTSFGDRVFANNLPLTTQTRPTFVNASIAAHPGLTIDRSTSAPRFLGLGNGAGNFSNITTPDIHGINGVIHIIDRVLLPQ
jgi:uncharacterized surface protein with fasciclin (FAS1) repeats